MDLKSPREQTQGLTVVENFTGPHDFLSNFQEEPFTWEGREGASAEHHYNAAKTLDPVEQAKVYAQDSAGRAKRIGRTVTLRAGWDDHLKFGVMESIIQAKFAPETEAARRLLLTGSALLIEGNRWHDQYWGQCGCERHYHWPGGNNLGRLLMAQRDALAGRRAALTRVGVTGHRPQVLSSSEQAWAETALQRLMCSLHVDHGAEVAISGMALGADTFWAQAALQQGMDLWAYIPSPDQDARWYARDRQVYADLISKAARTVALGETYDARWLKARNDLIVRDSSVLVAVHKESVTTGGTVSVIRKALSMNMKMIRVNVTRREVVAVTSKGEIPWAF